MFYYKVFGLIAASQIELPAFMPCNPVESPDFTITQGKEIDIHLFEHEVRVNYEWIKQSKGNEVVLTIKDGGTFFIKDGKTIIANFIEPITDKKLMFFYANIITVLLYQRNLIPFHVSGVLNKQNQAYLFAAPSGTGKSTIAVMLKEMGYKTFTDDTAIVYVNEEGKCMAIPSYPMTRLTENAAEQQQVYNTNETKFISDEYKKFGIFFHNDFNTNPVEVKGFIFMNKTDNEDIAISQLSSVQGLVNLFENIYRPKWLAAFNMQLHTHHTVTSIAKNNFFWLATRPAYKPTFESFAQAIINNIIEK